MHGRSRGPKPPLTPIETQNAHHTIHTGASTGIGNHAVKHLAGKHTDVVVYAGVRKEKDAEALRAEGLPNLR